MRSPLVSSSSSNSSNNSDWRQLQQPPEPLVRPRVATYRNAYGARFSCSPACYLALLVHVALLVAALALLVLVPVAAAGDKTTARRPPFVLWVGDDASGGCTAGKGADTTATTSAVGGGVEPNGGDGNTGDSERPDAGTTIHETTKRAPRTHWLSLVSSWWLWFKSQYEIAVATSRRAERTGLIPGVAVPTGPPKTYESIGVDTEDLLSSPPPSSPGRRGSIFANAPPPPSPPKRRATRGKAPGASGTEALSVSFGASETSFFSELMIASRVDTASELLAPASPAAAAAAAADAGFTPRSPRGSRKEGVVRDIERRASIQQRAEKRRERAKSDISYENLRDEEIQMYEYLEFVRELLEGMVVRKVCQRSAKVVKRTFFITKDMATVYWNKLGAKGWSSKKSSLDASRIDKVLKGLHGNANVEAKGKAEKSALYVSVLCSDGKRLDLEAKDEAMRQRLYVGFSRLATEKRHEKQQQQQVESQEAAVATATTAAPLHRLVVPEQGTRRRWRVIAFSMLLLLTGASSGAGVMPPSSAAAAAPIARARQLYADALLAADPQRARQLYEAAIDAFPLATAYNNLGLLLSELSDDERHRERALRVLAEGARVALAANDTQTYVAIESNLGFVLRAGNERSVALCLQAIEHFDRALAVAPDHVNAMYNKASALYTLREFAAAEQLNRRVLELAPLHVGANTDLGIILFYTRRDPAAAVRHQEVVAATAQSAAARYGALANKATFLRGEGEFARALAAYEQAYALRPDDPVALANVVVGRRPLCAWERTHELQDALVALAERSLAAGVDGAPIPPFEATLMQLSDAFRKRLAAAEARLTRQAATLVLEASRFALDAPPSPVLRTATPLRVGYVSYDFRDHPMGQLTMGFVEHHNRRAVESFCYSYGANDGSEWRQRAEAHCDTFRDVAALSDVDAARLIARDQVDVVVDLMGLTTGARVGLLALKPSRVVVTYLGYPGTTGAPTTDFAIVDRLVLPPERAATAMSEHVVYLPTTYQSNLYESEPQSCLEGDDTDDTDDDELLAACPLATRAAQGLPAAAVVLCNFNTINKMEPVAFALWMRVLQQVPGSVLWLLAPSSSRDTAAIVATLKREAQAHGVHGSRVIFAQWEPRRRHLARLALADVFLDSLVYNAHSTASDALWAGVPLVTRWGDAFPSRVAAAVLQNALAHLPELTPLSVKDYEAVAVQLATSPALRRRFRRELAASALASPLFDSRRTAAHLEAAYAVTHDLTLRVGRPHHALVGLSRGAGPSEEQRRTAARVQAAVQRGVRHQHAGDLATAQFFYHLALRAAPTHADALHLLGTVFFARGRPRTAQRWLARAIERRPDVALFRMNAGLVHLSLGERAEAAEQFTQVLRLEPQDVDALNKLVELAFDAGDVDAAVRTFRSVGAAVLSASSSPRVSDREREQAFLRFSYALAVSGRAVAAINLLEDAVVTHPTYYAAGYNLVVLYNQQQLFRAGEQWLVKVVRAESHHSFESQGARVRKLPRPPGRRVVAIYCHEYGQAWWGQWGPSSLGAGLGGSEEAVVFLSRELRRLGFWVEVYGDPPPHDVASSSSPDEKEEEEAEAAWYPHHAYDPGDAAVDVFVAWRYHASLVVGAQARARFLWVHDMPALEVLRSGLLARDVVRGVLCVSAFQAAAFPRHVHESELVVVTANGLDPRFFVDGRNRATRFVYGSAPSRGLERVLAAWPRIRAAIPDAHLTVFYGFTPAFDRWGAAAIRDFDAWKRRLETLLRTLPGVEYVGLVGHAQLARGYADAGFYLYPTTFPETSAVTLMKAMANGAIPITSRFAHSALAETCGEFDLGPSRPLVAGDDEWLDIWVESVVSAARDADGRVQALRRRMKAFARATYRWSSVAAQWHEVFERAAS